MIAFGYGDCVLVVLAFVSESISIESIDAWWIYLSILFDVRQYASHVVIHGVFLFLRRKYFRGVKVCKASWNIHWYLLGYNLLLYKGTVWLKEVDWAFLNHWGISCLSNFFEQTLKFCVLKLLGGHKFFDCCYLFLQFLFLLYHRLLCFL